jgi:hypothetical protein
MVQAGSDGECWGVPHRGVRHDDFAGSSDLSVVTQMAAGAPRYVWRFSSIDEQVPSSY